MARWIILVISVFTGGFCQNGYLLKPADMTVATGERTVIQCQVDNSGYALAWHRKVGEKRERIYLYYKETSFEEITYPDIHEIERNDVGQHNLVIKSAELKDGGRYTCERITPDADNEEMNLVVLETPLIMSDLKFLENTNGELSCEGAFGSPPDSLEFHPEQKPFLRGYINSKILDDVESTVTFGHPGISNGKAVYKANTTFTGDMDQKLFICEFRTEMPYRYLNSEKIIQVHHEVSEIEFHYLKDVYYPGDVINCSADGNPPPTFSWLAKKSNKPRPVTGSVLAIYESMIGENVWECRAQNQPTGSVLAKMITKTITFTVEAIVTTEKPDLKGAGANVTVIVVVCVLAVVIIVGAAVGFYCFKSRKNKKDNYDPQTAQKDFNLESDLGDIDDDDDEVKKKQIGKPESQAMLPQKVQHKEKLPIDGERIPLKLPLKDDIKESNGPSSQAKRVTDTPPTPPPPFEEAAFASLMSSKPKPAAKRVLPPNAKPVLPLDDKSMHPIPTEPPSVMHKPKPKKRSRSRENLADKPETDGEGTSV